jgi:plasmid stability protein
VADKVFVRNIPDDLWRALKARAGMEGTTVSAALQQAIRAWLAADVPGVRDPFAGITGLGRGDRDDVSERHDRYLAEAIHRRKDAASDEAPRRRSRGSKGGPGHGRT